MAAIAAGSAILGGLTVASAAVSINAQRNAAKAAEDASKFNQEISRQNALAEQQRIDRRRRKIQSSSVARVGSSGILLEGSPLEVLGDNAAVFEADILNADRNRFISDELESSKRSAINSQKKSQTASTVLSTASSAFSSGLGG